MWLALETATDQASVALGVPGAIAAEETTSGARRHAAALLPMVLAVLKRARASFDAIEGIVLADGPGSFTGLRVGAALAKALIHARPVPFWTASSLMTMAAGVSLPGVRILALSEALRGEVFAAVFRFSPGRVETLLEPTVETPEALMRQLEKPGAVLAVGARNLAEPIAQWAGVSLAAPETCLPRASALLSLVGYAGGAKRVSNPPLWEPDYGRPAEAQIRWEIAHGRRLPDSIRAPG